MTLKRSSLFLSFFIFAGSVLASAPIICPSIDQIKNEKLSRLEIIGENLYMAYHISYYNTSSNWGFILAPFRGESENVALEAANDFLGTMTAPGLANHFGKSVVCTYETGNDDIVAAAIKDVDTLTPLQFKHFLNNRCWSKSCL